MKQRFKYKHSQEVFVHLFTWVFLFGLPPMLIGRINEQPEQGEVVRMMATPIALGIVFYLNYYWMVPRYLFSGKYKRFVAYNLMICMSMLVFTHFWHVACHIYYPIAPPPHPKGHLGIWGFVIFRIRDFIIYGFSAALAAIIRMSQKWHIAEIGRQKAELKRTEAELKNLRHQINPHFLLNTLNNIYALIAFDSEKAQQAVQDLSRLLRHILYDNNQDFIPLTRELEFLKNYVELMRIRLATHVDLQFEIDIPAENNLQIAPLIFISLIENAFKHGISPVQPSYIHIRIFSDSPNTVSCRIENTNFPKKRNDISGSGIGLEQVQKRLELIYPHQYKWIKGTHKDQSVYTSLLTLQIKKS